MGHLAVLPTVPNLQVDPSATKLAKYLCGKIYFLGTLERRHQRLVFLERGRPLAIISRASAVYASAPLDFGS